MGSQYGSKLICPSRPRHGIVRFHISIRINSTCNPPALRGRKCKRVGARVETDIVEAGFGQGPHETDLIEYDKVSGRLQASPIPAVKPVTDRFDIWCVDEDHPSRTQYSKSHLEQA